MFILESPRTLSKHEVLVKNIKIPNTLVRRIALYCDQVGYLMVHMNETLIFFLRIDYWQKQK